MSHNFDDCDKSLNGCAIMCNDNPSVIHHWHPETLKKMPLMTLCGMVLSSLLCGANEIRGIANKCLDVRGGDSDNGTPVEIWPCHGGANQEWRFSPQGEIRGIANKCLDVKGGVSNDGTPVILWPCNGGANQQWRYVHGELPGVGDKCLDVKGGVSDDGTLIILWRCHGSANQKWRMRHFVQ